MLRFLSSTDSVLTLALHRWAAEELGPNVLVGSVTGGTDIAPDLPPPFRRN